MRQGNIEAHDLACEIEDFADLLAILMAGPDAECATNGVPLVALEISTRAARIKEAAQSSSDS